MKVVSNEDLSDSELKNPDLLRIVGVEIPAWQLKALMKAVT